MKMILLRKSLTRYGSYHVADSLHLWPCCERVIWACLPIAIVAPPLQLGGGCGLVALGEAPALRVQDDHIVQGRPGVVAGVVHKGRVHRRRQCACSGQYK